MLSFFMFDKVYMIKSQTYKNQKMHSNNIILFEYMSVCVCVCLFGCKRCSLPSSIEEIH